MTQYNSNPLLQLDGLPPFSQIKPEHVEPAIDTLLHQSSERIESLLAHPGEKTWDNFIEALDDIRDRINKTWSPVSHMNSVVNNEKLRKSYNACLPKISAFYTDLAQNPGVYQAYRAIADADTYEQFDVARKKVISDALRDFHLSGIDLPLDQQQRFKAIQQELATLTSKFSDNVLDATHAWQKNLQNEQALCGLPPSALAMARQAAQQKQQDGYLLTLEFPSYYAVMTYADDRALRRELHDAYVTRASDQGPHAGQWDNSQTMENILRLRHELAQLLGFSNYAQYSLATKMASSTGNVLEFLTDLAARSKPLARQELEELTLFARQTAALDTLEPWDIAYFSEKLRQHKYDLSQETLKPYFPEPQVVAGLFEVVKRLYSIKIKEIHDFDSWHKQVRFFEIKDADDHLRGFFYMDLYARSGKRGGAWMGECISRRRAQNGLQYPVAYLVCNFSPPVGDDPALFTHNEVLTLFHEFGHGLHHLLTQVDYVSVSGINGVAWDAVELPNQFMENWCWEREALDIIAKHYKTGEPLPEALYEKMQAAKNFQSGMQMVRQLEFALFDFRLHLEYDPGKPQIQQTLDLVRQAVAVVKPAVYNRFQHSFSHIFAGGYAAGYYSYKWAEVLSCDAFSLFEENGIFNRETGQRFLHCVLEQGGSREPMDLFTQFRGREPTIDALLRHSGITG